MHTIILMLSIYESFLILKNFSIYFKLLLLIISLFILIIEIFILIFKKLVNN
jgi:hypothetical protein